MRKYVKHSLEECVNLASSRRGQCLSSEYKNPRTKMSWRCSKGHEWLSILDNVLRGHWCQICANQEIGIISRKNIKDAIDLAQINGGTCLSNEYKNNNLNLIWKCKYDHIWEAPFNRIQQGGWCPFCSGRISKTSIEEARDLALKHNGKCLSDKYVNCNHKLSWCCESGHRWLASFWNISYNNQWCPYCSGNAKKSLKHAIEIASVNYGYCLSTEYINCKDPLKWKCKLGHIWEAPLDGVLRGSWCSLCSTFKSQKKLYEVLKLLFPNYDMQFNYHGFGWLGRQEIDIWVPTLNLAIEYDGEQHFRPVCFGGISLEKAKENFQRTKELDQLKNNKIASHPEDVKYFVRFKYDEPLDRDYIINKLTENNIPPGDLNG